MSSIEQDPIFFLIPRRQLIRLLLGVVGLLVLLHVASVLIGEERSWQMTRLFDLERESNVPTWFSSGLLGLSAIAAYGCGRLERSSQHQRVWMVMALALAFMSCDEISMIHENFGKILEKRIFQGSVLAKFQGTSWPLSLGPFIALGVGWLGLRLRALVVGFKGPVRLLVLGAVLFFGGALGVEMMTNFMGHNPVGLASHIRLILEETLEMLGSIAILSGLLLYQEVAPLQKTGVA